MPQTPPASQDPLVAAKIERYHPVEGPTNRQLAIGLWWVEHRLLLRRLSIGVLALINLGFWLPSGYRWGQYAYQGYFSDRQLARSLIQPTVPSYTFIHAAAAQDVRIGTAAALPSVDGSVELATEISNPNADWYVNFEYAFTQDPEGVWRLGYLIPSQNTYLIELAPDRAQANAARPTLRNLSWRRVTEAQFDGLLDLIRKGNGIAVNDLQFTYGTDGVTPLNRADFVVKNRTAYNFWDVDLLLEARAGGRLVSVNKYTLSDLGSGETKPVSLTWPGFLAGATVTVTPSVDLFNPQNLRPFNLGPGQEK